MAKDRFKTRSSYDSEFKYGLQEQSYKSKRTTTGTQTDLMKSMIKSDKLNVWEKGFVKNCLRYNNLTDKQKLHLNKIYLKLKRQPNY